MNENSYAGREYLSALVKLAIDLEIILIGSYPETDEGEESRCGGLWRPVRYADICHSFKEYRFAALKSPALIEHLEKTKYDFGIQGGTGILKPELIKNFSKGILNFHPGDLPNYRGCSAPEWQLYENNPIVCTCHLIDEGIDSGPIYQKKELLVSLSSYESFRASVYPEVAKFVMETIKELHERRGFAHSPQSQDLNEGQYRKYIGDEKIEELKLRLNQRKTARTATNIE